MIRIRSGVVQGLVREWAGAVEVTVRLGDGSEAVALAYVGLVGEPAPGERVLLNVTAMERGLGTGGLALVVALPDRPDADQPAGPAAGQPGHVVKAR
ncbi:MAG: DUF3866 family protein, partial [Lapillicoccus sp.]